MSVWLSTAGYALGDIGPAGGFIFYENPNYAADGWRYLEAAPFDQSAGAKWGCFRRAIAGARGTAVGTGKQNTLDMLAACTEPGTAAQLVRQPQRQRRWRLVPAVAGRTGPDVPQPEGRRASATSATPASPTTSPTGRRRSRPRTWRRTSISPTSAGCTATTRTSPGGCAPSDRSEARAFPPDRDVRRQSFGLVAKTVSSIMNPRSSISSAA